MKTVSESFLDKAPPLYKGGVIANTLGLHVFRTLYLNLWRMKPKKTNKEIQPYLDILDRDGIVVIPDFFTKDQFADIKKEYDEIYSDWLPSEYHPEDHTKRQKDFPEYFEAVAEKITTPHTPAYLEHFVNNKTILNLTSAVVHRKNRVTPHYNFWYLQRRQLNEKKVGELHSAAFPHADVMYPTIKVFFYMNDVDEKNAAYIYAKGSHKLSLKRIWFEYKLSIRYAKTKNDIVTDADIAKLGYFPESICGKANTMIISNNMGYHSRGDFSSLEPRITAQLDFRNYETWRNILFRNDKDLFSRVSRKFVKAMDKSKRKKKHASLGHHHMS
ncbi:MAG: phytanoyl-CoA dioxygenase family protein [bacterium]